MAIAFVAGSTASATTTPATTSALGSTVVAGQLLVVNITNDSGTTTSVSAVGDSKGGNTWIKAQTPVSNSSVVEQWYCIPVNGGASMTANCTWNTGTTGRVTMELQYFNGFTGTPTLDRVSNATGTSTSASGGTTLATTVAAELVVLGVSHASTTSAFSLGTGYTNLTTVNVANAAGAQSSKVVAATGAQSGTTTIAASRAWSGMISTYYDLTASAPTVTTAAATAITETTATGNGNVTSDGGATITERGVVWSTSSNPTTANSKATASGTTGTYTASITGLLANTLYHYRAYAINSAGTSYGADTTFTTLPSPTMTGISSISGINTVTF